MTKNNNRKPAFTPEQVSEIRQLFKGGESMQNIAKVFDRSTHVVRCVIRRLPPYDRHPFT